MGVMQTQEARAQLRRRVGDTPLVRAPNLAKAAGLEDLWIKMEGANPTGTQKDRVARLEIADAVARGAPGITVASCGNFGVAIAHAAFTHNTPCRIFVPADFAGERIDTMQGLGAEVQKTEGQYEDAVHASRKFAVAEGWYDANPGGANTQRTLVGYSTIAREIFQRLDEPPEAIGVPVGNGSTLAGLHLGCRIAWGRGQIDRIPKILGGTSRDNNPLPAAAAREQETISTLDPRAIEETHVNEPLVNWDALDGQAALTAIIDSNGFAYGHTDEQLMKLHAALLEDGVDAHPASLSAVAALQAAVEDGRIKASDRVVAVLTSGRPQVTVEQIEKPEDLDGFITVLTQWLGRFGDPEIECREAVETAFDGGVVLRAVEHGDDIGYCVLTPMELTQFFPKYHLSYIAVAPEGRGKGIGTILLEDAIRVTEGDLSLHVETDNEPAIKLYEKFGFKAKYYRMLYKGTKTAKVDPAGGVGWSDP